MIVDEGVRVSEMDAIRLLLRVSWAARKSNQWVNRGSWVESILLEEIKNESSLPGNNILLKAGSRLEREIIKACVEQ